MAAFDVLANLISQAPESMRPVLTHLGRIAQDSKTELLSHVGDNTTEFGNVTSLITQLADRVSVVEGAMRSINNTLVSLSAQVDSMGQTLGTSSTLENAPTIVTIKSEVAAAASAISDLPDAVTKLNDGLDTLRVQFNSPASLENAPLIQQMRNNIVALQSTSTS